ncbi:diguanylate cyclase [Xanthomonas sp. AmX2]|uniref:GGDEF domain-containing protein n=1 Tax=Xanthomonas sp. TaxID=29446 RepID=UPI00197CB9FE|nr:GGDEF domain-containing protein [Xanthomonas sp.]MBN6149222.1 diguanylate cyclase [Xanthomonas sp.]
MTPDFLTGRGRILFVVAGLLAGPALAQTIPGADPNEALLQRCRTGLTQQPQTSLAIANDLLSKPDLPVSVQVQATGCLATAQQILGDATRAAATVERVLALLQSPGIPPPIRAVERLQAANLLRQQGQSPRALKLLEQAQDEAVSKGDTGAQLSALIGIALIRGELDDPEGALGYFRQAIALSERLQRPPAPGDIGLYYNYGYALLVLQRYDEADRAFSQASAIAARFGNQDMLLHRIDGHRGEIQRAGGHYERAEQILQKTLQWQANGDPQGAVVTLQRLARLRLDQGRTKDALAYAEQAQTLSERGNFTLEIRTGLDLISEIHAALGNAEAAARYAQQARAMDRDKARAETLGTLATLQANAARKLQPIAAASTERADSAAHVAIGLALVLLLGATLVILHRRRARREAELGHLDPLTGLLNRPAAERRMHAMFDTPADEDCDAQTRCAIVLIDVDDFKALNERYGHAAGDRALTALAACLREACEPDDMLARWSGEEFLVVRTNTSPEAAFALAGHLRGRIERLRVDAGQGEMLPLTVSVGVAPFPLFRQPEARVQDAIALAERAVHAAGRAGGNGWAGLWAVPGAEATAQQVLPDLLRARERQWIVLDGSHPAIWMRASAAPAGASPPPDAAPEY